MTEMGLSPVIGQEMSRAFLICIDWWERLEKGVWIMACHVPSNLSGESDFSGTAGTDR